MFNAGFQMISCVAPYATFAADAHGIGPTPRLHPDEAECIAAATGRRRREFALGRDCARRALTQLGLGSAAIPRNTDRSPRWPTGIIGSITHTDGYVAALVARRSSYCGIGIDAERTGRITQAMEPLIFDQVELAWLEASNAPVRAVSATVLFSAKEAYYKVWNPLMGTVLSFRDVRISIDQGAFRAWQPERRAHDVWAGGVRGRFAVHGDLVLTSVCLPAQA